MRPRLIHHREVVLYSIVPLARDVFGDAVDSGIVETRKVLPGQVYFSAYDKMNLPGGGDDPQCAGHVTFYMSDWEDAGGAKGDELMLAPSTSRLVVIEATPCGHYNGIPHLVKVYFSRKIASIKGATRQ